MSRTPGEMENASEVAAKAVRDNIAAIAKLEEEFNQHRTFSDRLADAIGNFFGTVRFVFIQAVIFLVWILWNTGQIPGVAAFDPYPFMLLAMTVSMEAIFLTAFVLIKQDRMSRRADHRAHLDLQINLLVEREMTLVLQMLNRMSARLGVQVPPEELEELCEETSVATVASELRDKLPVE